MPDIVNWYLESLATFWGSALRIGLPQIILLILLVCWLRRKCCGKSRARCGWTGAHEGRSDRVHCRRPARCGCACGCCQHAAAEEGAHAEATDDA